MWRSVSRKTRTDARDVIAAFHSAPTSFDRRIVNEKMALSMPIAPAALSSRVQTGIASFRAPVAAPSRGSLQVMAASKKKDVRLTITLECTEQKASGVPGMSRYMSQKVRAASVEPEASSRASSRGVPGADKDAFSRETLSPGALVVSRANAPRGTGAPRTRPSARRGPSPAPRHLPLDASRARTPSSPPPTPPEHELTSTPPLSILPRKLRTAATPPSAWS